ncbi:secreted protein [Melampsora americana]|nr:secreted protein [Melampsora americana]
MTRIQPTRSILLGLVLIISVIPIICDIAEGAEGVMGFSRIRPLSTRLEDEDEVRPNAEYRCGEIVCANGLRGAAHCASHGCFLGCTNNECN